MGFEEDVLDGGAVVVHLQAPTVMAAEECADMILHPE
jgi:hypothetical protein